MNDQEKSEAAGVAAPTTSESNEPAYHDEAEESADSVPNPPAESKADSDEPADSEGDNGTGDVTAAQSSNPIVDGSVPTDATKAPAVADKPVTIEGGGDGELPSKPKRGRPAGSKNKPGGKKPAKPKLSKKEATEASVNIPPPATEPPKPAEHKIVARKDIILSEPYSTLLPIQDATYASIKAEMRAKGFDPTYPVHLWFHDGEHILADGYTRIKAADEVGITDAEMFALVAVYDQKVKPGSTQERNESGTFKPKASNGASGKSATKTAEVLNTTTTNIERARYLHKYADAATKNAIASNKMKLSRACEVVSKQLAAPPRAPKKSPAAKGGGQDDQTLSIELTPESEVAFAVWNPVIRIQAELGTDPEAEPAADHEVTYELLEELLGLPTSTKKLGTLSSHRILVSPSVDLFAEEVPVKTVRKVLQTAAAAKQFQFLFTTGDPERLQEFSWEENTFVGVSIFEQGDVAAAEQALLGMEGLAKWLVVEQLTMDLSFQHLHQIDWLVVRQGAGVPGATPDPNAMKSLLRQAWAANCPVLFERGIDYRPTDIPKAVTKAENEDTHHE